MLTRVLADRLAATDRRRVADAAFGPPQRLASYLLELADPAAPGSDTAHVALSQTELASLMGISRDTTIRALRQLRALDLVHTRRRMIVVRSLDELRRYVARL